MWTGVCKWFLWCFSCRLGGWASTRLWRSCSSTTKKGPRSWEKLVSKLRAPSLHSNIRIVGEILIVTFQVLLEAQEMAVKNHNVEYKSNLHVGEWIQFGNVDIRSGHKNWDGIRTVFMKKYCSVKSYYEVWLYKLIYNLTWQKTDVFFFFYKNKVTILSENNYCSKNMAKNDTIGNIW